MVEKLGNWRVDPSTVTAGELLEASLVEGVEREAAAAARFLLSSSSTATLPVRRLAALALKRAGRSDDIPDDVQVLDTADKAIWRARAREYPDNPLAWVELSLHDVISGKREAARRAMRVALQLAPDSRHVLRSAARLFLHLHEPDLAHDILLRSARTPFDPWLMSAEMAIAELAHREARFFGQGRVLIKSGNLRPRQATELASALGTLELVAGGRKKARDFFRESLLDPTGNSLAQAEWASPSFGAELVPSQRLSLTNEAGEATALHLLREQKVDGVTEACERWSASEPYSIRPFEVGSGTAAAMGKYTEALAIAQKGLLIRPDAPWLLNNRAFALIHLGRLRDAERALQCINKTDDPTWFVSEANRGLLAMRRGEHAAGVAHYRTAIEGFREQQKPIYVAVAQTFLAREAALAGLEEAKALIKDARDLCTKAALKGQEWILKEAEEALSRPRVSPAQTGLAAASQS
ncbi:tetratricopeptide repeat protein [Mesorhizobium humile]|uniref:Tetratricopeptide repeat protein n=1 Tax=Mesorhizobium humile TaxID=3072313 RepID=A0ABU4Y9I6_9HYPH|nr:MULTISPECIES: tetratricopeptide repeat protein [unclassified Mesorhizobium]MDX8458186.1 tetratricopeptide repeat protein [Mesorhizobium sp. VK2D]MDX8483599.1 tetratricopeptide repeat protein [Mesorhizobium sp. VK2B]